jgi:Rhodopirellula transposase DDE domain
VRGRVRRPGAGRRKLTAKDPTLLTDLETLLEPATMGDPMRPLRWVSKSHDKLATALCAMGHKVSASSLPKLLEALGYRRHVNRKTKDGGSHPDRDAQFEYINAKAREFQAVEQPVISVGTTKKELIGEFKNPGSDYGPKGEPIKLDAHDFENKQLGKVVPYGVYDVGANKGYVSLGIDHDTAPFAINDPAVAREDGPRALPGTQQNHDHRRLRRLERAAPAAVEGRVAAVGRRDGPDLSSLPLAARHLEMEYDRAPHVLSYQPELAGHATDQPTNGGRTARQHPHQDGADHPLRTRHQVLPQGDQGARRGDRLPQSQGRRFPLRVELYHLTERTKSGAVIFGSRLKH